MKQAITGSWVYISVLIFMVILIAYVAITINYTNAYEDSEKMIKILEQYEGFNAKSRQQIENILHDNAHTVKHACPDTKNTGEDMAGVIGTQYDVHTGGTYDYCIARSSHIGDDDVVRCFYHTYIYFSFSLPVLGDLFAFQIPGETTGLREVADDVWGKCV